MKFDDRIMLWIFCALSLFRLLLLFETLSLAFRLLPVMMALANTQPMPGWMTGAMQ